MRITAMICFPAILLVCFLVLLTSDVVLCKSDLTVTELRCEYKSNPVGIDVARPRLSWQIVSGRRNTLQSAYEIRAGEHLKSLTQGEDLLWNTGKVNSVQSIHLVYAGPEPVSRQRIYWQVRGWDDKGNSSEWSAPAF